MDCCAPSQLGGTPAAKKKGRANIRKVDCQNWRRWQLPAHVGRSRDTIGSDFEIPLAGVGSGRRPCSGSQRGRQGPWGVSPLTAWSKENDLLVAEQSASCELGPLSEPRPSLLCRHPHRAGVRFASEMMDRDGWTCYEHLNTVQCVSVDVFPMANKQLIIDSSNPVRQLVRTRWNGGYSPRAQLIILCLKKRIQSQKYHIASAKPILQALADSPWHLLFPSSF